MKFFEETTNYKDSIPNGTYLMDDSKTRMYAFVKAGSKYVFTFKNPIRIDTRGRTFKAVDNTFEYVMPQEGKSNNPRWEVKGSKGDTYIVEKTHNGLTCTCSGFKFRASCKHITEIAK
jgi:hypothetical protein